jgi:hypothetical protein
LIGRGGRAASAVFDGAGASADFFRGRTRSTEQPSSADVGKGDDLEGSPWRETGFGYNQLWCVNLGKVRGARMNALKPQLRSLVIALMAIAGTVLVGGGAPACEVKAAPKAAKSCCVARPAGRCGCCGETNTASPVVALTTEASLTPTGLAGSSPFSSCECRASDPAAPTDKTPERPSESRPDDGRPSSDVAHVTLHHSSVTPRLLIELAAIPPDAPIFLRTSHLRF